MILDRSFYSRNALEVAKNLLGKILVREIEGEAKKVIITETEAYHGYDDKASHGYKGRTPRTEVIYDTVGHTYIYLIYGMYWMLNITTFQEDFPSAVLIRGAYDPGTKQHINGPGKLTRFLGIDKTLNALPVFESKQKIVVEESEYRNLKIHESKRVGVDYAQESKDWLWRFYISPEQLELSTK